MCSTSVTKIACFVAFVALVAQSSNYPSSSGSSLASCPLSAHCRRTTPQLNDLFPSTSSGPLVGMEACMYACMDASLDFSSPLLHHHHHLPTHPIPTSLSPRSSTHDHQPSILPIPDISLIPCQNPLIIIASHRKYSAWAPL